MAENQTLRNLVRSLAGFIGDGAGGLLPKLGWDIADFNAFISKSETDTAWESFQRRKKSHPSGEASSSGSQLQGQKRSGEEDSAGSRKKTRTDESEHDQANGYPLLVSMNHPMSATYSPNTRPHNRNGMFPDSMRGADPSPLYMHQSPPTNASSPYNVSNSNMEPYQTSFISNVNMTLEPSISYDTSASRSAPSQQQRAGPNSTTGADELEPDDDPNRNEAYKLIQYAKISSILCLMITQLPHPGIILTTSNEILIIAYRCLYDQP